MTTVAQIIGELDAERKERFAALEASPLRFTDKGAEQLRMAPVRDETVFLLPIGEPFFEAVYPALQQLHKKKERPSIHVGVGGTRNLSIIGATKADAAVLVDFNLNQQILMECLAETAKGLIRERGIGEFGPQDFVEAFSKHATANALLENVPDAPRARSKIEVSLEPDLNEPGSWLNKAQKDGRFDHIMRLFAEDKIATLALNVADTEGFQQLSGAVERIRNEVPDLHRAEVGSMFLSNIPYFLEKTEPFGGKDKTPPKSLLKVMHNVGLLGNPYVICAKERLVNWKEILRKELGDKNSKDLGADFINGPAAEDINEYQDGHQEEDRIILQQVTMGGYCDTMTTWFGRQKEAGQFRKQFSVYATPASKPPQPLRTELCSARGR